MFEHLRKYVRAAGEQQAPDLQSRAVVPAPAGSRSAAGVPSRQPPTVRAGAPVPGPAPVRQPGVPLASRPDPALGAPRRLILQVDGTPGDGRAGQAGLGFVVRDEAGRMLLWRCARAPAATNNEAEYQAVLFGLWLVLQAFRGAKVLCLTDSLMVVDQLVGRSGIRSERMGALHAQAVALCRRIGGVEFVHIPRELNQLADVLAWEGLAGPGALLRVVGR